MTEVTPSLGRQMLVRKLISQHAARRGYPAYANEATATLFAQWLELPAGTRLPFYDWIIQLLGTP